MMQLINLETHDHYGIDLSNVLQEVVKVNTAAKQSTAIKQMTTRLAKLFAVQGVAFLKHFDTFKNRFTESVTSDELGNAFDLSTANDQMQAVIQEFVEKGLTYGANDIIGQFDAEKVFSLDNPRAVAYTKDYAANTVTGINETSKATLRRVLERGVDNGWSYDRVVHNIKETFNTFSTSRARLIAVTEMGNAYQEGNMIVARDLQSAGLTMEKRWLTVGDDAVDPDCNANADEGWIPVDQTFSSGADRPLAHPRCRCVLQFQRVTTIVEHKKGKRNAKTITATEDKKTS